jgi:hypothetical protein
MKRNKSSGLDGIPAEFYQDCWKIIKEILLALFDDIHASIVDLIIMKYGIITLIQKKKEANEIKQFGLICLLNVCFKIFRKVLSIKIDPVINKIVFP